MKTTLATLAFALSLASGAAPAIAHGDGNVISVEGRCDYPPQLAAFANDGQHFLTSCSSARFDLEPDKATFEFLLGGFGAMATFTGTLSGDTLTVTTAQMRGNASEDASGECRIFRREGEIDSVGCLVKQKAYFFVTRFVRSRINGG